MNWPRLPFLDWCRRNPLPEAQPCPATQDVHRQRKGNQITIHRLLLAEVADATGRSFPAVEKRFA